MKITLSIIITTLSLVAYSQAPVITAETSIAKCGKNGEIILNGLIPEITYKVSTNNGESFKSTNPDGDGKIVSSVKGGTHYVILKNDFGTANSKVSVPMEGGAPTFTTSSTDQVCEKKGTMTLEGLTPDVIYRVSYDNGENYDFHTADKEGKVVVDLEGGEYDILVANDCGFTKTIASIAKTKETITFTTETEPSQCGKPGVLTLTGLDPDKTYEISTNNGEKFSFLKTSSEGSIVRYVYAGTYKIIVKSPCGTQTGEASVASEGSAPAIATSIEAESAYAKRATIVFGQLTPLSIYQLSLNNGQNFSYKTANEEGEVRIDVELGKHEVILKNKCGSSNRVVPVSRDDFPAE
ncbi:MAG: hypothetical protein AB8B61_02385 [Cyclobacteriaceae bacterium]